MASGTRAAKRRRVAAISSPKLSLLDRLPNELLFDIMLGLENPRTLEAFSKIHQRTRDLSSHQVIREAVWKCFFRKPIILNIGNKLFIAAKSGRFDMIRWLLEGRKCYSDRLYRETLVEAAKYGHTEIVKWFVENTEVDVEAEDFKALVVASAEGHLETVQYLASVGDPATFESLALWAAAHTGELEVVKFLAPLSNPKDRGSGALTQAIEKGDYAMVKWLVENTDSDTSMVTNDIQTRKIEKYLARVRVERMCHRAHAWIAKKLNKKLNTS